MANYIMKYKGRWAAYLSYHSYSQLILTPWGYTSKYPENYKELMRVAKYGLDAFRLRGSEYTAGTATNVLCEYLIRVSAKRSTL